MPTKLNIPAISSGWSNPFADIFTAQDALDDATKRKDIAAADKARYDRDIAYYKHGQNRYQWTDPLASLDPNAKYSNSQLRKAIEAHNTLVDYGYLKGKKYDLPWKIPGNDLNDPNWKTWKKEQTQQSALASLFPDFKLEEQPYINSPWQVYPQDFKFLASQEWLKSEANPDAPYILPPMDPGDFIGGKTTPTVPVPGQTTPGATVPPIKPVEETWKTGAVEPWMPKTTTNLNTTVGGVGGLLNTGPLNNYTQPFKMPQIGGGGSGGNQAMKNLAGASMDLWDYKRPDYGGTSVTGAANWSDLLNFGG